MEQNAFKTLKMQNYSQIFAWILYVLFLVVILGFVFLHAHQNSLKFNLSTCFMHCNVVIIFIYLFPIWMMFKVAELHECTFCISSQPPADFSCRVLKQTALYFSELTLTKLRLLFSFSTQHFEEHT